MSTDLESSLLALMADPVVERELLEGSSVFGGIYADWEKDRRLISDAINRSGSLLDIGCANGFLMLCLAHWTSHTLDFYGIDVDESRLNAARSLFNAHKAYFVLLPIGALEAPTLTAAGLPPTYDFVYWNVWDNLDFQDAWAVDYLERVICCVRPGGRLILGFYDLDLDATERKLSAVSGRLGTPIGHKGPVGHNVIVAWWDLGAGKDA